jgi:hypothetical protein
MKSIPSYFLFITRGGSIFVNGKERRRLEWSSKRLGLIISYPQVCGKERTPISLRLNIDFSKNSTTTNSNGCQIEK